LIKVRGGGRTLGFARSLVASMLGLVIVPVAPICFLLAGCQTPERRSVRLETGMSRSDVIALLGPPKSVVHNGSLEVMNFDLSQHAQSGQQPVGNSLYVIFGRDRRVQSFGPN